MVRWDEYCAPSRRIDGREQMPFSITVRRPVWEIHERMVYVELEKNASLEKVERRSKWMPYFPRTARLSRKWKTYEPSSMSVMA